MIDSHCHLHLCDDEVDDILARAADAGLSALIQVATDVETAHWSLELKKRHRVSPELYTTAGLYPTRAAGDWRGQIAPLREILEQGEVVALGEAGLDFYRDTSYNDEQCAMLRSQVEMALEFKLPLILHCRKASEQLIALLSDYRSVELRGVWHCFDGTLSEAISMIEMGFYISLSGLVSFKNTRALQQTSRELPRERVMIETDSPYLSPVPLRGRPNEPAHVVHVRNFLSELWDVDPGELDALFSDNTRILFGLDND